MLFFEQETTTQPSYAWLAPYHQMHQQKTSEGEAEPEVVV